MHNLWIASFPAQNVVEISDFGIEAKWLTLLYHSIFMMIFVVYVNSYTSEMYSSNYLSLVNNTQGSVCSDVPLTVSAKNDGDFDGN